MAKPDRRSEILDGFDALVDRYGVEKVSVHEVAAEVGISVGTLYNEFGSKNDMVESAADRLRDRVIAGADGASAIAGGSAETALRALILGWVRALMDLPHGRRFLLFRSLAPRGRSGLSRAYVAGRDVFRARLAERIAAVLTRGVGDGTFAVDDIGETADRLVDAFTEYWPMPSLLDREPEDVMRRAGGMLELLLRGLRTR
jgi:AcrR family transcriptional regulator